LENDPPQQGPLTWVAPIWISIASWPP